MARTLHPGRRVRRIVLIPLLAAACADPTPQVRVAGAPLLLVDEGDLLRADVALDPPANDALFAVEMSPIFLPLFEVAEVAPGENGLPELRLQPTCNAVTEGSGDIPVPVRVTESSGRAAPAELTVLVRGSSVAEPGACAPSVDAWLGTDPECLDEPPQARTNRLAVPPRADVQTLCLRVRRAPADHEPLWLTVESAPPSKLLPGRLFADEFVETRLAISIVDSRYFRGEFQMAYQVFHAEPDAGVAVAPFFTGSVTLVVGDVGELALSATRQTLPAVELGVSQFAFRVWRYDDAQDLTDDSICVLAFPTPRRALAPLPRDKPYLRIYDTQGARSEGWLCSGDTFFARVSPAIDSRPDETVTLVACRCSSPAECDAVCFPALGDCDGEGDADEIAVCLDVFLGVTSVADELARPGGDPSDPLVCADVEGDATPEILAGGALYAGIQDRYLAPIAIDPPASALALSVGGVEPVILGAFPASAEVRRLSGGGWAPAIDLGFAPGEVVPLDRAAAAGVTPGAPTHLVWLPPPAPADPSWSVELRCLSTGCVRPILAVAAAPVSAAVAGIAPVDLDGGGDDVVLFVVDAGELRAIPILIDWSGPTMIEGAPVTIEATLASGRVSAAADGSALVFAWDGRLYRLSGSVVTSIPTPGPALAVAATHGRLVVSTPFGLKELGGASPLVLAERDPLVQEDSFDGVTEAPPSGYGAPLAACVDPRPVAVFSSSTTSLRVTGLDVVVDSP